MNINNELLSEKIDQIIRILLYIVIFWLPYAPAVIETCIVLSVVLWFIKRFTFYHLELAKELSSQEKTFLFIKAFRPTKTILDKPIVFFLCVCSISLFGNVLFEQSLRNFITKTLEWFIVYYLIVEVFRSKRHFFIALIIFIITSCANALDSVIQYHWTYQDIFSGRQIVPGDRATGGLKSPNSLGAYSTIVIPLFFSLNFIQTSKFRNKILFFFCLGVSFWSLIVSFSKGAWLATALGILLSIYILISIKHRKKRMFGRIIIIAGLILIIVGGIFLSTTITGKWRLDIWYDSLKMIKERPFFGHGINTYMDLFQHYRRMAPGGHVYWATYAHNCYVQLAVETGVVGLVCFLSIIFLFFRKCFRFLWQFYKKIEENIFIVSTGLISGICAFLVHSFFDINFYSLQLSIYLWMMIGMQMAIINMFEHNGEFQYGTT